MRGFFTAILALLALGAGAFGGLAIGNAQSAVHEIEAMICFLIVAVSCGAGVVAIAVDEAAKKITKAQYTSTEVK